MWKENNYENILNKLKLHMKVKCKLLAGKTEMKILE